MAAEKERTQAGMLLSSISCMVAGADDAFLSVIVLVICVDNRGPLVSMSFERTMRGNWTKVESGGGFVVGGWKFAPLDSRQILVDLWIDGLGVGLRVLEE